MFLVKSCSSEFHPLSCNTIRIGTLDDYRDTPIKEIADKFEGTFNVNVNLQNKQMSHMHFNTLNYSHNSFATFTSNNVSNFEVRKDNMIYFENFDYSLSIHNNNRFVFCWSDLDSYEECHTIFNGYDNYWYIKKSDALGFLRSMVQSLYCSLHSAELEGVKVFEGEYDIKNVNINVIIQNVHYRERHFTVDNDTFDENINMITQCLKGAALIKPIDFSRERESRVIFDFYHEGKLLHPSIKSQIIKIDDQMKSFIKN